MAQGIQYVPYKYNVPVWYPDCILEDDDVIQSFMNGKNEVHVPSKCKKWKMF
jgi:hypothetical protein